MPVGSHKVYRSGVACISQSDLDVDRGAGWGSDRRIWLCVTVETGYNEMSL